MGEGVDSRVREKIQEALKVFEQLGAHVEEMSLAHTEYAVATYYLLSFRKRRPTWRVSMGCATAFVQTMRII